MLLFICIGFALRLGGMLKKWGVNALGEGYEEGFTTILDPVLQRITGVNPEAQNASLVDVWNAVLDGTVMGGLMGAPGAVTGYYGTANYYNNLLTEVRNEVILEPQAEMLQQQWQLELDGENSLEQETEQSYSNNGVVEYEKYKEVLRAAEQANELIDSLRAYGALPSNYITKAQASQMGWKPGTALENYASGAQRGGDVFDNTDGLLPMVNGRIWFEADVGLVGNMSRAKQAGTRLLYSNDGLLYITTDHYRKFYFIGVY